MVHTHGVARDPVTTFSPPQKEGKNVRLKAPE